MDIFSIILHFFSEHKTVLRTSLSITQELRRFKLLCSTVGYVS